MQLGQYPAPRHTLAHLSDTHLLAGGKRQYGTVDPEPGLVRALERLGGLPTPPQAVVLTGDLTDLAEPAAYNRLRELVEPVAAELGAQIVWVMGNHDERSAFSSAFFGEASTRTQDRVYDVAGLRVVALDTSVPGWHHGELDDSQLAWLADVLADPAEHGTVLAMHHPPVPLPLDDANVTIELEAQDRLAEVLDGSDVRTILAGHMHYSTYSTFVGIPVSVASASCYTVALGVPDKFYSAVDGHQAIAAVHLYDEGAGGISGAPVVHSVLPLGDAPEVTSYPTAVADELASLSRTERRELLSRKGREARAERREFRSAHS
ncbi:metallophosphoesterase [Nocardioides cheoyonin]|uniref:metallophosphoesterase n=1 Tax=Nocardioides cheoyonin TaxID=3156615 RepID=UPI0032B44AC1